MATETVSPPRFQIARSECGDQILYAESDEAFCMGCAAEAVSAAVGLLGMLRRERRGNLDPHEFGILFDNTMARVVELLNAVNIGDLDDSVVESGDIADTVFGLSWLVGERRSDGSIVVAGAAA